VLIDGFVFLSQEQVNLLALAAAPPPPSWDSPYPDLIYSYPILVAPEWPEKTEQGSWVIFSMDGAVYAFEPEVIKAKLETALRESSFSFPRPVVQDYATVGLFQQQSASWWRGIV